MRSQGIMKSLVQFTLRLEVSGKCLAEYNEPGCVASGGASFLLSKEKENVDTYLQVLSEPNAGA